MRSETWWILAVALCWGGYPLIVRSAGYDGPRGALILMLAGFAPILVVGLMDRSGWPGAAPLVKLLVAGALMGGGLLAFYTLANSPMDASISIPIVDVAMLLVTAVGAILLFSEPLTAQKTLGIALMVAGIALLRPS